MMESLTMQKEFHMLGLILLLCLWVCGVTASVSYDHKALVIDGQRRILISGSIHYPRSTPEMWPDLFQKAKDGGLDVIQTYVFWNGHEPSPGNYYFEDRFDLVKFVKLAQQAGLYVHLRIGPYVCAEWNYGGFPVWLKYVPGMAFRTDNEPFKAAMQKFTTKIVTMMKAESLFQTQGGPIIMSQIENEYGPVEWEIGAPGKAYTKWAAQMAVGLDTGVPWDMCKQEDAPDPVIDTCNGYYCENFTPNENFKPKMWTENWSGWYTDFGGAISHRPTEDLAYSVARFIQNRGSFVNYYMYHGGTNFGRTSSGLFIATSYDYDAPIDEYGLPNEPKWSHLKNLHKAIKQCEPALISVDPTVTWLGNKNLEAHVYYVNTSVCAAFLANYDTKSAAAVTFGNGQYDLPPWSVSILPDCKTVVFNTATVNGHSFHKRMTPVETTFDWQSYSEEPAYSSDDDSIIANALWEQINVTRDSSDYLWYLTDVNISPSESFIKNGQFPTLTINSAGHVLHVFVNGQLSGTVYGGLDNPKVTFSESVNLKVGNNKISLLSVAVGLPNVGLHFETWNVGVLGPVRLNQFSILFLLFTTPFTSLIKAKQDNTNFVRSLDLKELNLENKQEKLSHLKFYWHDIVSGNNPSSIPIVPPPLKNSTTGFGLVNMIENPLTLGPQLSSKLVGKAQGFYASTSQSEVDLIMAMNFAIIEGKYNGSTITILGRNPVYDKVREMPIIGGSGLFRFARGYAQLRTHWFSSKTNDAIVEYNIYVLHY